MVNFFRFRFRLPPTWTIFQEDRMHTIIRAMDMFRSIMITNADFVDEVRELNLIPRDRFGVVVDNPIVVFFIYMFHILNRINRRRENDRIETFAQFTQPYDLNGVPRAQPQATVDEILDEIFDEIDNLKQNVFLDYLHNEVQRVIRVTLNLPIVNRQNLQLQQLQAPDEGYNPDIDELIDILLFQGYHPLMAHIRNDQNLQRR